jgi:hypothetical protein
LALACAICETRKEKRFCPAVHGRICPTCCGTEREVTLDCPSECPYLQQARRHERTRDFAEQATTVFPQVDIPEDVTYRREPLIVALSYCLVKASRRDRALHDGDVMAALNAIAKTHETLVNSGLFYETPTANPVQQVIVVELQTTLKQYREAEQKQVGYSSLRDSEALQVLVLLLRLAHARTSGRPRSRAFLDFLAEGFREKDSLIASPDDAGSRLIVP